MKIILPIFYIAILVFLLYCLAKNKDIKKIVIFESIAIVISASLTIYFNHLPGKGIMPGITYLGEFLFSFIATIMYTILLVTTLVIIIFKKRR